jgi:site-specific DNA recombinase
LKKHGVVVISITQETSDDPSGELARRIFSVFDEYQSKENAKHTLRAMNENARRGCYNGSAPPFGYRVVEMDEKGNKGKKKRLEVDHAEAAVVKRIFDLYVNGHKGNSLGMSGIERVLNDSGSTMRGREWKRNVINKILENHVYRGEYIFNKREGKTRSIKPQSEWIVVAVEAIIDEETFAAAKKLRFDRSPVNVPPRVVNSPTLLTGLLKCGVCGAPMTLATGKGGRYRYYKCRTRITKGKGLCEGGNIAVGELDSLILDALTERIFTPARVSLMLKSLGSDLRKSKERQNDKIAELSRELDDLKRGTDRLYEAVEKGLLPLDSCLHDRVHHHQARRQEILIELAGARRQQELPLSKMGKEYVHAFCSALSAKLKQKESNFGKEYIRLLVDEIRVEGREVYLKGSYRPLAAVVQKTKLGTSLGVPNFGIKWLPEKPWVAE